MLVTLRERERERRERESEGERERENNVPLGALVLASMNSELLPYK